MMDRLKALMILKEIDNMDTAAALGDKNLLQRWLMRGDEAALKNMEIRAKRKGLLVKSVLRHSIVRFKITLMLLKNYVLSVLSG